LVLYQHHQDGDQSAIIALAGLKIPTGKPSQLSYERDGGGDQDPDSAVGGHDLALGFGAWDPILGFAANARHERCFVTAQATYEFNTEGAYDYQVADEFAGDLGVGYVVIDGPWRLSAQADLDAESKGADTVGGMKTDDTQNHHVFAGPELGLVVHRRVQASLAAELPIYERNSATQLVPTWRLRAGIDWRF
jgi:hypothetical protein